MAEMHVYVIDKNGNVLGAVRKPHERAEYYSRNNIRVDDGKIYYLSAELEAVYVYELTPGKTFENRLNERIETFFNEEIKENLLKKSEAILILLKTHDWDEFSNHVHPDGLTFSFYAALGADPNNNLTFTKKELELFNTPNLEHIWGMDHSEKQFIMPINEYVDNYLFKYMGNRTVDYSEVNFNKSVVESGGVINTIPEKFPRAKYVEYFSPNTSEEYPDWQALRLVFEEYNGAWYLMGIVRDIHNP